MARKLYRFARHDLPGLESNITEGVANGDKYFFISDYERQKHIRIRDVRLGKMRAQRSTPLIFLKSIVVRTLAEI